MSSRKVPKSAWIPPDIERDYTVTESRYHGRSKGTVVTKRNDMTHHLR